MFTNSKLAAKFIVPISGLIFMTALILSVTFISHEAFVIESNLRGKAELVARDMAWNAEYGVLTKNLPVLSDMVKRALGESGVIWAEISDLKGQVLASAGKPQAPVHIARTSITIQKESGAKRAEDVLFLDGGGGGETVQEEIGSVKIGVSLVETYRQIRQMRNWAIGITLLVIGIGIVLTFILVRRISLPLRHLSEASARLAGGDLSTQAVVKTQDEVGDLAAAFNSMAQKLKTFYEGLEEKVRERTAELLRVNSELRNEISEREKAEHRIEELGRRNELILNSAGEGICGMGADGNFSFINPAGASMLGLDVTQTVGLPMHQTIHYAKADGVPLPLEECPIWKASQTGESSGLHEDVFWHKNGSAVPVEYLATPIIENGKPVGAVVTFRDRTERQKMEAEKNKLQDRVLQSEKLAAVGQLAGGVAHEINNPLGVILGFAQILARQVTEKDAFFVPVQSIEREAKRCKNLVQELLTFSRVGKTELEVCDVNQVIEGALTLVEAETKTRSVDLIRDLPSNLPKVTINRNQVQQVVVNLCNNAVDAMERGGILTVGTGLVQGKGGGQLEIWIRDTGTGIPKEIQKKIFEPFFTTKEVGKGTGLGLSLVYEIVQKHRGTIEIESEDGKGTTFHVFFPLEVKE